MSIYRNGKEKLVLTIFKKNLNFITIDKLEFI